MRGTARHTYDHPHKQVHFTHTLMKLVVVVSAALAAAGFGCGGRHSPAPDAGDGDGDSDADGDLVEDADAEADVDSDAEPDSDWDIEGYCGDREALARWPACLAAEDQESCEAAGGTWAIIGLAPFYSCQCPTGQSGCVCDSSADCLAACTAPFAGGEMWNCEGVVEGTCSPGQITVGCHCFFFEDGTVEGLCVD